jgi:cytochrome P450
MVGRAIVPGGSGSGKPSGAAGAKPSGVTRPFEDIPRVPIRRLLGQVFANVFLFGPDANRAVLLERAQSLSSRAPWMQIMGTIFPNGLLLRDGAEHRHHRKIMHGAFKRPVLREYVERMNPAVARGLDALRSRRSPSTSRPRSLSASTSGASRAA